MFAIRISDATMPLIREQELLTEHDKEAIHRYYCNRRVHYYMITGYVTRYEKFIPWTVLPDYQFEPNFDHDPEKIKTDWVQIVRMNLDRSTSSNKERSK